MNQTRESDSQIKPDLVRRTTGGWLAIAPKGAKFPIGVTATTAEEAEQRFRSSYNQWLSLSERENI